MSRLWTTSVLRTSFACKWNLAILSQSSLLSVLWQPIPTDSCHPVYFLFTLSCEYKKTSDVILSFLNMSCGQCIQSASLLGLKTALISARCMKIYKSVWGMATRQSIGGTYNWNYASGIHQVFTCVKRPCFQHSWPGFHVFFLFFFNGSGECEVK